MLHIQQLIGFGAADEAWSFARVGSINSDTSNATTYTFSSVSLGALAFNREIVVVATVFSASTSAPTATLGGVSMTRDQYYIRSANGAGVAVFRLANVSDVSATIAVTWSGTCNNCSIVVYRMTGRTGAVTGGGAEGAGGSVTDSVTVLSGGTSVIGFAAGAAGTMSWTGATVDQSATVETQRHSTALKTGSTGNVTADVGTSTGVAIAWASYG